MKLSADKQFMAIAKDYEKTLKKANSLSLNHAARKTKTEASRLFRSTINLKAKDVSDSIKVVTARAGQPVEGQRSQLIILERPVPLFRYGARTKRVVTSRGKRTGVTVQVSQQRKLVTDGFIATTKRGYTGVFKRTGDGRMPIKHLYGPNVLAVLSAKDNQDHLLAFAQAEQKKEFERQLARLSA
jgi:hypothetical protein